MRLEKAKKHILTNVSKAVGILTIITIISKFWGCFVRLESRLLLAQEWKRTPSMWQS